VNALSGLDRRFRHLVPEGAKFAIVGLAGVAIVLAGTDVLRYGAGLGRYASVSIATVAALIPNFAGNRYWTFRCRQRREARREGALFLALNGAGLLLQYACIVLAQVIPGMAGRFWYTAANLLGIGLGAIFRFAAYRRWVWHAPVALPGSA